MSEPTDDRGPAADASPRAPVRAAADWDELLLICRKCQKKQPGDALPLRKWLKRELKARDLGRRVRIIDCGCLDLCPKRGVTMALGRELGDTKQLRVWRDSDDPRRVLDWVLDAVAPPPISC